MEIRNCPKYYTHLQQNQCSDNVTVTLPGLQIFTYIMNIDIIFFLQYTRLEDEDRLGDLIKENRSILNDVFYIEDAANMMIIHHAIRSLSTQCLLILIYEAKIDVNRPNKFGITPLHYAARQKHFQDNPEGDSTNKLTKEIIHSLLKVVTDIDAKDKQGLTALHHSVVRGNEELVEILVNDKANLEARTLELKTPLLLALNEDNHEITQYLLKNGAEVDVIDSHRNGVFHYAAKSKRPNTVALISRHISVKYGREAVVNLINSINADRLSPLHLAIQTHSPDLAEFEQHGADFSILTKQGETLLHVAISAKNLEAARFLIENGKAKITDTDNQLRSPFFNAVQVNSLDILKLLVSNFGCNNINEVDLNSYSPLLLAAKLGLVDIVKFLLQNSADPMCEHINGKQALSFAIENKSVEVVEELLNWEHPDLLLRSEDLQGSSPLHLAASIGDVNICAVLLEKQASLYHTDFAERTVAHVAAKHGNLEVLKLFLQQDFNLFYSKNEYNDTPLHLASRFGHTEIVEFLLSEDPAILDQANSLGSTPLICATIDNKLGIVELLLSMSADVNLADKSNRTALFISCENGYHEITEILLKNGADPCIRLSGEVIDKAFFNSLDAAVDSSYIKCAQLIIQSDKWHEALNNVTSLGDNTLLTPFRRMILNLPEAARMVMDRCIEDNDLPDGHLNKLYTFDYRYIDNADAPLAAREVRKDKDSVALVQQKLRAMIEAANEDDEDSISSEQTGCCKRNRPHEKPIGDVTKYSPLKMMLKHRRQDLLRHDLVLSMVAYRWIRHLVTYWLDFATYVLFLTVFTAFMLLTTPTHVFTYNKNTTLIREVDIVCAEMEQTDQRAGGRATVGLRYTTFFIALIASISEGRLMISDLRKRSFGRVSIFCSCFLALLTTTNLGQTCLAKTGLLKNYQWCTGSVGICVAWLNLIIYLFKAPFFGIYVIMFINVLRTFTAAIIVFSPLVFAFGITFHLLLSNQTSFATVPRALVKVLGMTVGEVDMFDLFFDRFTTNAIESAVFYQIITAIILIVFLGMMTIVAMNLLVGLAVDDIKRVQLESFFERERMRINDICEPASVKVSKWPRVMQYQPHRTSNLTGRLFRYFFTDAQRAAAELREQTSPPSQTE